MGVRIIAAALVCAGLTGCPKRGGDSEVPLPPSTSCDDAAMVLGEASALRAQGFLGRALTAVDRAVEMCGSKETLGQRAALLADLWIDGTRVNVREEPTEDDVAQARLLYRAGQVLRKVDHDYDLALERFEQSYALMPHPLTIVQMGLSHRDAGREIEYRMYNARALAVAELLAGESATPRLQLGHFDGPHILAFHPERPILVTAAHDGRVVLWDLTSGRPQGLLDVAASSVAFPPDASRVAVGAQTGVYSWVSGDDEASGWISNNSADAVAFSPDGTLLAGAGFGRLSILDAATSRPIHELRIDGDVQFMAFSPDGTELTVATYSGARRWSVASAQELPAPLADSPARRAVALSAGGALLATVGASTTSIWDLRSQARVQEIPVVAERAAFSGDGAVVVLIAETGVSAWEAISGKALGEVSLADDEHDRYSGVAVSPDGDRFVAARESGSIELRDTNGAELVRLVAGFGAEIDALAVGPHGPQIGAVQGDDSVRLWTLDEPEAMRLIGHHRHGSRIAFDAEGRALVSTGEIGIMMWDASSGGQSDEFAPDDRSEVIAASADGRRVASIAERQTAVWDAQERRVLAQQAITTSYASMVFSPDGALVAREHDRNVELWDVEKDAIHTLGTINGWSIAVEAFSADGAMLAVDVTRVSPDAAAGFENDVEVWDTRSGKLVATIPSAYSRHGPVGNRMAQRAVFRPGSPQVAIRRRDDHGTVDLWSVSSGTRVAECVGHAGSVSSIAFSPDGRLLATGGADRTIKLWVLSSCAPLATLLADGEDDWVALGADGRVDGSAAAESMVYWQVGRFQLPGFVGWQRQHEPGFLATL